MFTTIGDYKLLIEAKIAFLILTSNELNCHFSAGKINNIPIGQNILNQPVQRVTALKRDHSRADVNSWLHYSLSLPWGTRLYWSLPKRDYTYKRYCILSLCHISFYHFIIWSSTTSLPSHGTSKVWHELDSMPPGKGM